MIDIAWSEFLFIALLALILIGPKELPTVLRYGGRMVGKARAFAKEFAAQLDLEAPPSPWDGRSSDIGPPDHGGDVQTKSQNGKAPEAQEEPPSPQPPKDAK